MRLHRIRLTNVRGVAERSIVLPDSGVTVVEGPNETGKTTTADAVDVLFEAKDSSKAQRVRELYADGADAGPRVEIEFSTRACRGVYAKQWGRGRSTQLTLTAPRRQRLSGDEAHARARQLLDADVDPALWRALKIAQGQSMTPAAWQHVPSLGQALDRAAATSDAMDSTDCGEPEDLFARIRAEAERFFTPRTGQPTGGLALAISSYERAADDVRGLRSQERQAQADVADAARYEQRLASLGEQEGRHSDVLKQARDDAARVAGLREAVQHAEAAREELAADVSATAREHRQRDREAVELTERSELIRALRPRVEDCLACEQAISVRRQGALEQLDAARETRTCARAHAVAAQRRSAAARQRRGLATLVERLGAAQRQRALVEKAAAVLVSCRVDDVLLSRIEQASAALSQAEQARELAAPTVTVVRLGHPDVHVDGLRLGARGAGASGATVGDPAESSFLVTDERTVEVPGVIKVSVRPGTSGSELTAAVGSGRSVLAALLTDANVVDLDEARATAARRRAAQQQREVAESAARQHLDDDTLESLQARCETVRRRLADSQLAGGPDATSTEPPSEASLIELDRVVDEAAEALEVAERHLARNEHVRDGLFEEHAALQRRLAALQEQLAAQELEHRRVADRLTEARVERSDESLNAAALDAQSRLAQLEDQLAQRRREVSAADPSGVELRLEQAEQLDERLASERRKLQSLADQVRGRLMLAEQAGLFDRLEDAEAALDSARRELLSVQRHARAARLLARHMATRRDEARSRYIAPYRSAIRRLGLCVFGDDFDVEIDAELRVVSRTLAGHTLSVASLSGGAREQLALVERLACAELVGPEAEVPVVIDDALGFSDPQRLQSMGVLLSAASEHSQVIVLTCQPQRYQHVADAHVIRLRP